MPRIMAKMMLATKANSTSIHFGMGHQCNKHQVLFITHHICECDTLTNCMKIRDYANKLKVKHFLDWKKQERMDAIGAFESLVVQMQNLTQQHRATLVQTARPHHDLLKPDKKTPKILKLKTGLDKARR